MGMPSLKKYLHFLWLKNELLLLIMLQITIPKRMIRSFLNKVMLFKLKFLMNFKECIFILIRPVKKRTLLS